MDSKNKPDWFKGKWLKKGGNVKSYVDGKEYKLSAAQLSIFDEMGGIWLVIEMTDPNAKEAIKNLKEGFNKCVEWWIINDIKLMRSLFTAKQLNIGVDVLPTLENKETKYVDANSIEYFDKIISLCKRRELRFDDIEQYKQEAQNEFYMDKLDVIGELGFKELDNTLEHLKTFSTAMIYGQCKAFSAMVNPEYEKNTYQHFFAMTGLDIGGEATYKKFLYEQKKREKNLKSKTTKVVIKEIRFGPQTDEHDYEFKKKHAIKFLNDGAKLKAFVFFKGRSIIFKEQGQILLLRLAQDLEEIGKVEQLPELEGKRMIMLITPKKK